MSAFAEPLDPSSLPLRQPKIGFRRRKVVLPPNAVSEWSHLYERPEPTASVRDIMQFLDAESPEESGASASSRQAVVEAVQCLSGVSDHDRSSAIDVNHDSMLSSSRMEEAPMAEKYVSIISLLKNKKTFRGKEARTKSGFVRLLRERFKLNLVKVYFPGENGGRAVSAITEAEAQLVLDALSSPQVVQDSESDQEK